MQYAKAYASLIGTIATALLGIYAADSTVGQILLPISVIATVVATWAVPNLPGPDLPQEFEPTEHDLR